MEIKEGIRIPKEIVEKEEVKEKLNEIMERGRESTCKIVQRIEEKLLAETGEIRPGGKIEIRIGDEEFKVTDMATVTRKGERSRLGYILLEKENERIGLYNSEYMTVGRSFHPESSVGKLFSPYSFSYKYESRVSPKEEFHPAEITGVESPTEVFEVFKKEIERIREIERKMEEGFELKII